MKKEKNVLLLTLSFKKCACCGEVKPTTEFSRKKHRESEVSMLTVMTASMRKLRSIT